MVIEQTATGYSAYSTDLPGCIATGRSMEEVQAIMCEAMEFHWRGWPCGAGRAAANCPGREAGTGGVAPLSPQGAFRNILGGCVAGRLELLLLSIAHRAQGCMGAINCPSIP